MSRQPEATESVESPAQRRDAGISRDADEETTRRGVAYQPHPLPLREEDEEELSQDDILEEIDLDELDFEQEVAK